MMEPRSKTSSPKPASPKAGSTSPKTASPPAGGGTESPNAEILPPQHWAQLAEEIGDNDDADSAVVDTASSTASMTSSILQYRTINGRTYHSDRGDNSEYWGPIDDAQQEAMDINHHVITLLCDGKLHLAPISKDIQTAVDIGTGTGIWAIDFADEYPNASVVGTDLSPIQPSWVPPNLQFQIDDCLKEWTFKDNSVDYVHARWLIGSIDDWTSFFKQAYNSLAPGGWLESLEPTSVFESDDGSVSENSAIAQWGKFFIEGGRKLGRPFTIIQDDLQKKAMEEAGFVDIEVRDFKNPMGSWPADPTLKEVGTYMQLAFDRDAEGTVLFMATLLGWTKEEVTVYLSHFRREFRKRGTHAYFRQRAVWGRKPETA